MNPSTFPGPTSSGASITSGSTQSTATRPTESSLDDDWFGDHYSDNDSDGGDIELAQYSIKRGREAFDKDDYVEARPLLREALDVVSELPENQRATCDVDEIHVMLSRCAFHLDDAGSARDSLMQVMRRLSVSSTQNDVQKLDTDHLLTQTYVKLGQFEEARIACERALKARKRLLGETHESVYESRALLARIFRLQGKETRADLNLELIPEQHQSLTTRFADLNVENENETRSTGPSLRRASRSLSQSTDDDTVEPAWHSAVVLHDPLPGPNRSNRPTRSGASSLYVVRDTESAGHTGQQYTYQFHNPYIREWAASSGHVTKRCSHSAQRKLDMDHFRWRARSPLERALVAGNDKEALRLSREALRTKKSTASRRLFALSLTNSHYREMCLAVLFGVTEVFKLLLARRGELKSEEYGRFFDYAMFGGNIYILEHLIHLAGETTACTSFSNLLLRKAVVKRHVEIYDLLLRHRSGTESKVHGYSTYHVICAHVDEAIHYLQALGDLQRIGTNICRVDLRDFEKELNLINFQVDFGKRPRILVAQVLYIMLNPIALAVLRGSLSVVKWAISSVGIFELGPFVATAVSTVYEDTRAHKNFAIRTHISSAAELAAAVGEREMTLFLIENATPSLQKAIGDRALKIAVINKQFDVISDLQNLGYCLDEDMKAWARSNRITLPNQDLERSMSAR